MKVFSGRVVEFVCLATMVLGSACFVASVAIGACGNGMCVLISEFQLDCDAQFPSYGAYYWPDCDVCANGGRCDGENAGTNCTELKPNLKDEQPKYQKIAVADPDAFVCACAASPNKNVQFSVKVKGDYTTQTFGPNYCPLSE